MPPAKKYYKTGETVFGLWPGSGGLYFKGVIVETDHEDGTYDVKFEEGTTYTLLEKHVNPVDSFKALEPKSSQRQVRRRGRSSSASRSRSRSRTPGRKQTGYSTTTPSRNASKVSPKQEKESKPSPKRSPKEETEIKPSNLYSDSKVDLVDDIPLSTRRSNRIQSTEELQEDLPFSRRRSSRIAEKVKVLQEKSDDDTSDENTSKQTKPNGKDKRGKKTVSSKDSTHEETVKPLSSFAAILTTTSYLSLVVYLYLICKQNKCLFKGIPHFNLSDLLSLYNPFASLCVEGFYLILFLLSLLPTGEVVEVGEGQFYRYNSLFSAVASISSLLALKHYFQFSASKIMTHIPQFLIPNLAVTFVLAVAVSFRTRKNRNSETSVLSHFVVGSVTNVAIAGVDVKFWVHRAVFITMIVLNCLALEADFEQNKFLSPTLASVTIMQILFALEALKNDSNLLLSFEFVHVKTGWMYLTMLTYPLMAFLITLSAKDSGSELPYYYLAPIGVLFLAGLWIKVASTTQKTTFAKDPDHPSFANMESLASATDGKLLISGWWGWLRHPNDLGDLLIHVAFVLPCGFRMFLPYSVLLFISASLICRVLQNDAAGKLRYGPSWERYCQRVPSRMIPHVF